MIVEATKDLIKDILHIIARGVIDALPIKGNILLIFLMAKITMRTQEDFEEIYQLLWNAYNGVLAAKSYAKNDKDLKSVSKFEEFLGEKVKKIRHIAIERNIFSDEIEVRVIEKSHEYVSNLIAKESKGEKR